MARALGYTERRRQRAAPRLRRVVRWHDGPLTGGPIYVCVCWDLPSAPPHPASSTATESVGASGSPEVERLLDDKIDAIDAQVAELGEFRERLVAFPGGVQRLRVQRSRRLLGLFERPGARGREVLEAACARIPVDRDTSDATPDLMRALRGSSLRCGVACGVT